MPYADMSSIWLDKG